MSSLLEPWIADTAQTALQRAFDQQANQTRGSADDAWPSSASVACLEHLTGRSMHVQILQFRSINHPVRAVSEVHACYHDQMTQAQQIISDSHTTIPAGFSAPACERHRETHFQNLSKHGRHAIIVITDAEVRCSSHGKQDERMHLFITDFRFLGGSQPEIGRAKSLHERAVVRVLLERLKMLPTTASGHEATATKALHSPVLPTKSMLPGDSQVFATQVEPFSEPDVEMIGGINLSGPKEAREKQIERRQVGGRAPATSQDLIALLSKPTKPVDVSGPTAATTASSQALSDARWQTLPDVVVTDQPHAGIPVAKIVSHDLPTQLNLALQQHERSEGASLIDQDLEVNSTTEIGEPSTARDLALETSNSKLQTGHPNRHSEADHKGGKNAIAKLLLQNAEIVTLQHGVLSRMESWHHPEPGFSAPGLYVPPAIIESFKALAEAREAMAGSTGNGVSENSAGVQDQENPGRVDSEDGESAASWSTSDYEVRSISSSRRSSQGLPPDSSAAQTPVKEAFKAPAKLNVAPSESTTCPDGTKAGDLDPTTSSSSEQVMPLAKVHGESLTDMTLTAPRQTLTSEARNLSNVRTSQTRSASPLATILSSDLEITQEPSPALLSSDRTRFGVTNIRPQTQSAHAPCSSMSPGSARSPRSAVDSLTTTQRSVSFQSQSSTSGRSSAPKKTFHDQRPRGSSYRPNVRQPQNFYDFAHGQPTQPPTSHEQSPSTNSRRSQRVSCISSRLQTPDTTRPRARQTSPRVVVPATIAQRPPLPAKSVQSSANVVKVASTGATTRPLNERAAQMSRNGDEGFPSPRRKDHASPTADAESPLPHRNGNGLQTGQWPRDERGGIKRVLSSSNDTSPAAKKGRLNESSQIDSSVEDPIVAAGRLRHEFRVQRLNERRQAFTANGPPLQTLDRFKLDSSILTPDSGIRSVLPSQAITDLTAANCQNGRGDKSNVMSERVVEIGDSVRTSAEQIELVQLQAVPDSGRLRQDIFARFKIAYPRYGGDLRHFFGRCRAIDKRRAAKTLHRSLWDDHVVRHQTDYLPYVAKCGVNGDDATPFDTFYDDEFDEPLCREKVLTPDTLSAVLEENDGTNERGSRTISAQPTPRDIPDEAKVRKSTNNNAIFEESVPRISPPPMRTSKEGHTPQWRQPPSRPQSRDSSGAWRDWTHNRPDASSKRGESTVSPNVDTTAYGEQLSAQAIDNLDSPRMQSDGGGSLRGAFDAAESVVNLPSSSTREKAGKEEPREPTNDWWIRDETVFKQFARSYRELRSLGGALDAPKSRINLLDWGLQEK